MATAIAKGKAILFISFSFHIEQNFKYLNKTKTVLHKEVNTKNHHLGRNKAPATQLKAFNTTN